jgi:hypothetical protein
VHSQATRWWNSARMLHQNTKGICRRSRWDNFEFYHWGMMTSSFR